ncbi:MAG: Crp/Fnr family transcriptional regulator [Actinobacteria bacterium]|nr:MAG: Crp/Fnr family transcriptional regulator [Actinomycetota bacterium]
MTATTPSATPPRPPGRGAHGVVRLVDARPAGSLAAVEEHSFLDALDPGAQEALRGRGTVRRLPRGVALFHEQTVPSDVAVLLAGRVKLTRVTAEGRDVLLAIRGPGELLGEQSALDGTPRSATAVALEPVEALTLAARDFVSFVSATPSAALFLMRLLSRRLRDADDKRVGFASQDTLGRVAARLVELAERYGTGERQSLRIDVPITQEDLASWTGTSREGVSRALQTLRSLGWVETARRSITVLDLDALRGRSG